MCHDRQHKQQNAYFLSNAVIRHLLKPGKRFRNMFYSARHAYGTVQLHRKKTIQSQIGRAMSAWGHTKTNKMFHLLQLSDLQLS